ncbi:MAG: gliding motility protein GldM [Prevotellaceae bacterium]|jgi:gliding motility-associated protein GldM|nr:gliding motility protein GldM [Prevotellaceae bacterium]
MAGGGKQTPRQKMINMMYLVLTAMLALNVSAEVLDAFAKIERGLEQTIIITDDMNTHTLGLFEDAVTAMGKKAVEWRDKAASTREKTKAINEFIRDIKIELIKEGDGELSFGVSGTRIIADSIEAMDDRDAVNRVMMGTTNNGRAYELLPKLEEYREFLLTHVAEDNTTLESVIKGLLNFDKPKKGLTDTRDWQTFTFDNTPLISAVALLSKIQVDVLNCESSILDYLKNQIGKEDIKISNIEAAVSNPNGVIMKGASSEAEVFLVAIDESIQATAHIGGRAMPMKSGKIVVPFSGNSIGPNAVAGYITYLSGTGETQKRDFKFEYHVVEPSLAISPTKMNVFYLGVENPVDISVSGVAQQAIKIHSTNGTISPVSGGGYIVKPAQLGKCNISVTATINGEEKNMGTKEFRVKRVPSPTPSLFNISGSNITRSQLSSVQGLVAKMPDDFDFDLKFEIVSFTISAEQGTFTREASSTSSRFTQDQRQLMEKAKVGSRFLILEIKAKGPDGSVRELPPLAYKVN